MPLQFSAVGTTDLSKLALNGSPVSQLSSDALAAQTKRLGLPTLGDEQQQRMLLGALITAATSSDGGGSLNMGTWSEVREEARGLLLLGIRREGSVSASTAEATTVLNKPAVVEKYKTLGNRWTMSEAARDVHPNAVERAREALGGSSGVSTGEWLQSLAAALDAPVEQRPWWTSKPVLLVLTLTALFILVHVVLLVRVLLKVHAADSSVLLLPIAGLSASAVVGAFAIGVHVMTGSGAQPPRPKRS
jgi:hypothetical protein